MPASLQRFSAILILLCFTLVSYTQNGGSNFPFKKESKPFKILTAGKQITIRSQKEMKAVMVWTASGHRMVEQTQVNRTSFSFNVAGSREKYFFVMVQYEGQRPVTDKIMVE